MTSKVLPFKRPDHICIREEEGRAVSNVSPEQLPAPPIGQSMDLRHVRLIPIDEELAVDGEAFMHYCTSHPEAGWFAVLLRLESWDQVPCGSLPAEDAQLALLAHADAATWARVRKDALMGWYRCSDGRLYHCGMAQVVKEMARLCGSRRRSLEGRRQEIERN